MSTHGNPERVTAAQWAACLQRINQRAIREPRERCYSVGNRWTEAHDAVVAAIPASKLRDVLYWM